MARIIIRQHRIYRVDIQANPHLLYLFGDNLDRQGMGGQAGEMRGEPNSFGIATKRSISHSFPDDYFHDHEDDVIDIINKEFISLYSKMFEYRSSGFGMSDNVKDVYQGIVIPSEGLGTGLSRMPELAPKALAHLDAKLDELGELNNG